ncbi:hypothetical protein [Flavobacterium sp. DG2-3]|uniref:hypothetical protein n=1 Tax=Flavobacterium sp. DG2-3 TaxID=3068317 RepID=UPI00273D70AD|nr:hypothetical protein [Flavobacterium sp. DG2-3]MDP5200712.1 hypothetical protein [Flavobacterium sp. DG2-3]
MSSISVNNKVNILFYLYFISTLLFPTFFLNKLIFVLIIGLVIVNFRLYRFNTISPFVVFFIFLYGFIFSFFNYTEASYSTQLILSILVLFLIYPIIRYKIDVERVAKVSGLIAVAYTGLSFLIVVVFMDLPFSAAYYDFFSNYSAGSNGLREFADEGTLSFHIGCVPFLYLPFVLYFISFVEKRKLSSFLASLVIFITIFVSASRGSILTSIIAAMYIVLSKSRLKTKIIVLTILIILGIGIFSYLLNNTNALDPKEESNGIKIGHYESFIENLNFFKFFLGEGLASYYYSKGSQRIISKTEITPIDMLRYFGFILAPLLYFVIIFPTKKIASYLGNNSLYMVLTLIYVLNSMTNPTMFNSYGLLIILWYWFKILPPTKSIPKYDSEIQTV